MGGIGLHDQLMSLYRFSFKSKKYYQRIIWHLFDMALVNASLIYKWSCDAIQIPRRKQNQLSHFKARVAKSLMFSGKLINKDKRGRLSTIEEPRKKKIINQGLPLPEEDIRFDGLDHLPKADSVRHMCKMPCCKRRIIKFCHKCKVYLCISQEKECLITFHTN